jgi:hypothetical protein
MPASICVLQVHCMPFLTHPCVVYSPKLTLATLLRFFPSSPSFPFPFAFQNITNHQIRRHVSAYAPQSGAAVPQQRLFLTQYEIEEADRRISGPRAIPRIRKPTKELFASGIRAAGRERTVILSHTMDDWKGMERWKDPSFFKQLGDLKTMIPVEMVVPGMRPPQCYEASFARLSESPWIHPRCSAGCHFVR